MNAPYSLRCAGAGKRLAKREQCDNRTETHNQYTRIGAMTVKEKGPSSALSFGVLKMLHRGFTGAIPASPALPAHEVGLVNGGYVPAIT